MATFFAKCASTSLTTSSTCTKKSVNKLAQQRKPRKKALLLRKRRRMEKTTKAPKTMTTWLLQSCLIKKFTKKLTSENSPEKSWRRSKTCQWSFHVATTRLIFTQTSRSCTERPTTTRSCLRTSIKSSCLTNQMVCTLFTSCIFPNLCAREWPCTILLQWISKLSARRVCEST